MLWVLVPCGIVACLALGTDPEKKREQEAKRRAKMGRRGISRLSGSYAWEGTPSYRRAMPRAGVLARPSLMPCPKRPLPHRNPVESGILPWFPEMVDQSIVHQINAGHRDCEVITNLTLREVYPVTSWGEDIPWPCIPGDSAALACLEERVRIRVRRHLAEVQDIEAEHEYPDDGMGD